MRTFLTLGILLLSILSRTAWADNGFEARKARLLEVAAGEQEKSLYTILAKLRTGHDTARAYAMLDSMTTDKGMGGMFYSMAMIGTYLHTRNLIPDSLARKIREAYRVRTMYRGDTENHWVMYYTGLYLAAQTWPGEDGTRWFNGKSSDENFQEAREWIERWMNTTFTIGQGEYDSPTYSTVFISPMLVLYEFAKDPVMKRRAQMTLDLLFADFAVDDLNGNYGGGHSRDYPEDIINPMSAPISKFAWLFFGQPAKENWDDARYRPRNQGSWESVLAAAGSYKVPDIVFAMATDRSVPYVQRKTARVRNIIRFSDVMNPPVYKYAYMTADYVIGSLQGGILQPIQQHTWDVTFGFNKPNNTLFTLHPFYSGKELAMFFPEEQKFLSAEVDRYHKVYTNPDKWNSSSPYEQTFQQKNAIIVLYDIAPGVHHQHIDGFFPKTLDARNVDSTGWIFCKAGDAYVAFFPLQPYEWKEEDVNWRWRSSVPRNGVVVQVSSARESGSFEAFMNSMRKHRVDHADFDQTRRVRYTTLGGDVMQFTFDGPRLLNGTPVNLATGKLYDGPFMTSKLKSGVVTLKYKGHERILDMKNATIQDRP